MVSKAYQVIEDSSGNGISDQSLSAMASSLCVCVCVCMGGRCVFVCVHPSLVLMFSAFLLI